MTKRTKTDEDGDKRMYWEGVGEVLLTDHLSATSRALRRNFMIASSIGAITAITGAVPTSIVGVDISEASQSALVWFLILAILYTGTSFAVYAWPERMRMHGKLAKLDYKPKGIGDLPIAAIPSGLRNFLDYKFPYILALISVLLLAWILIPAAGNPYDSEWLGIIARLSITLLSFLACWIVGFRGADRITEIMAGKYKPNDPDEIS